MDEGFIFGNFVSIWNTYENERVMISIGTCTNPSVVYIYEPYGVENRIMVLTEVVNEDCEQWKLWCPIPNVKYYESIVGIDVFWPYKYLSMNDEEVMMVRDQCHVIVDGANNLLKKQVSCKDDSLAKNFWAENIHDVENMGNTI